MSAPRMPNPAAVPAVAPGGVLSPEWVRYIQALTTYIEAIETENAALRSRLEILEAAS